MEAIFKAKSLKDKSWVEGYYYKIDDSHFIVPEGGHIAIQVIGETVCRFTGVSDKDSSRIYENDVVDAFDVYGELDGTGTVTWNDFFSGWEWESCKGLFGNKSLSSYKIVGNKFDGIVRTLKGA